MALLDGNGEVYACFLFLEAIVSPTTSRQEQAAFCKEKHGQHVGAERHRESLAWGVLRNPGPRNSGLVVTQGLVRAKDKAWGQPFSRHTL